MVVEPLKCMSVTTSLCLEPLCGGHLPCTCVIPGLEQDCRCVSAMMLHADSFKMPHLGHHGVAYSAVIVNPVV